MRPGKREREILRQARLLAQRASVRAMAVIDHGGHYASAWHGGTMSPASKGHAQTCGWSTSNAQRIARMARP